MTDHALNIAKPTESLRQRLIRTLLYGRNVDRAAKARARVGLAILAFSAVFAIIAARLMMYAIIGDSHGMRRTASRRISSGRRCRRSAAVSERRPR